MSGKCDDCKREYVQFQATSLKNDAGVYQTKRYQRCPQCGTVYVEVDPLQDDNYHTGKMVVEKYPPVKKEEVEVSLDNWM